MTLQIAIFTFILSAGIYGAIAFWRGTKINSIDDFFHIDDSRGGTITLIAGNLTLGTGLVYLASLAQQQALFSLVSPIGVFIGYFLLSKLVSKLKNTELKEYNNILEFVNRGNGSSIFFKVVCIINVVTFTIIVPFEIFISANLLSDLVGSGPQSNLPLVFAVVIFIIVLIYSTIGGFRGVVATDKIQAFFIGLMIILIFLIIIFPNFFEIKEITESKVQIGILPSGSIGHVIVLAISSFFTAVTTQFYNIVNLSIGTSFDFEKQANMYKKGGIGLSFALILVFFIGISTVHFGSTNYGGIDLLLKSIGANSDSFSKAIIFLIVFGMVAVLISSVDSFIMGISQTTYANVLNNDPFYKKDNRNLLKTRILYVGLLNLFSVIPLLVLFNRDLSLVNFLLTSISALTVASPILVSAVLNISKHGSTILNNYFVSTAVIIFILSVWGLSIYNTLNEKYFVSNCTIICGVLIGILFYFAERKYLLACDKS